MNKRNIIIIVIAVIAAAGIFALGSKSGREGLKNGVNDASVTNNTNATSNKSENTNKNEQSKADIKENKFEKAVKNGSTIIKSVGTEGDLTELSLKVLNANEMDSVTNKVGTTKASGKFIVVEVSMKNTATSQIYYSNNDYAIHDKTTDISYAADDNSVKTAFNLNENQKVYSKNAEYVCDYDTFNPGIIKKSYMVFDVPKDLDLSRCVLFCTNYKSVVFDLK